MIICHCNAVSEKMMRKSIAAGADNFFKYSAKTGVGDDCGTCIYIAQAAFERILNEKKTSKA